MLPSRIKKEKKSSSYNSTVILSCVVGLLALSVVCSISLIVINFIALRDSQNMENDEIRYLFLVLVENESEISVTTDFDASIIDGGVVKVSIDDPYYAEELGVLSSDAPIKSDQDLLYSYFAYIGAFCWEYLGKNENTFIFGRNS